MDLSIVIPVWNEEAKIEADLRAACAFFSSKDMHGEIIVADDGSTDGTVERALTIKPPPGLDIRIVKPGEHVGKGHALRLGVIEAKGDVVLFADSGFCIPFEDAMAGIEAVKRGECAVAHGSRKLDASVIIIPQTTYRRFGSWLFMKFIHILAGVPGGFSDTQCGFKVYKGESARALFQRSVSTGFMLDIEVMLRALRVGLEVSEFPVHWRCDPDSRLRPLRAAWRSFWEILKIRRAMAREKRGK